MAVSSLLTELTRMQLSAVEDDIEAAMEALGNMRVQLDALKSACTGGETSETLTEETPLAFEGEGARVMGPFTIPAGVYRISGEFLGDESFLFGAASLERLSGDCGVSYSETTRLFSSQGGREETVFRSQDCETLLEITGNTNWSIVFEKVD